MSPAAARQVDEAVSDQVARCGKCGATYSPARDFHLCIDPYADGTPTLGAFMESDAAVRGIVGPVGSGKSSMCVTEILRRATAMPKCKDGKRRSRFVIIRNTYGELRDTTRKTFEDWLDKDRCNVIGTWSETEFVFRMAFGEVRCEVLFRALDRPDHIKKLLSLELTGAYINEAKEIPQPIFDMVQTRVGRYPAKRDLEDPEAGYWSGVWFDTNPPDDDHWIFLVFEKEQPRRTVVTSNGDRIEVCGPTETITTPEGRSITVEFELFKQPDGLGPHAENIRNLEDGYYQKKAIGKAKDWIDVYLRGRYGFVKEGKPVYPEFNDQLHVGTVAPNPALPIVIGMDFGLTPAAVLGQRAPDGQWQFFRELVSTDMGAVTFARELRHLIQSKYPNRELRGWGDPSGGIRAQTDERTPFSVVQEAGLPIYPAPTNDWLPRRESVAGLMLRNTMQARPALVVDPVGCPTLRKGLAAGYHYAEKKLSGSLPQYHDTPEKNHYSHVCEAQQYACVGEGEHHLALHGARARGRRSITVRRAVKGGV